MFQILDVLRGTWFRACSSLWQEWISHPLGFRGLRSDVLVAGRIIYVPTLMTYIVFEPHFQFETDETSVSTKTDGVLTAARGFSRMLSSKMSFEASVTEKVSSTVRTTFGGFETARVGVKEIGALFLETSATLEIDFTTVTYLIVVGFEAVGTHVTDPEKPWETGDDIIMTFLVERDQLRGLGWFKTTDMEGTVRVHQEDLVLVEGGGCIESG